MPTLAREQTRLCAARLKQKIQCVLADRLREVLRRVKTVPMVSRQRERLEMKYLGNHRRSSLRLRPPLRYLQGIPQLAWRGKDEQDWSDLKLIPGFISSVSYLLFQATSQPTK